MTIGVLKYLRLFIVKSNGVWWNAQTSSRFLYRCHFILSKIYRKYMHCYLCIYILFFIRPNNQKLVVIVSCFNYIAYTVMFVFVLQFYFRFFWRLDNNFCTDKIGHLIHLFIYFPATSSLFFFWAFVLLHFLSVQSCRILMSENVFISSEIKYLCQY